MGPGTGRLPGQRNAGGMGIDMITGVLIIGDFSRRWIVYKIYS